MFVGRQSTSEGFAETARVHDEKDEWRILSFFFYKSSDRHSTRLKRAAKRFEQAVKHVRSKTPAMTAPTTFSLCGTCTRVPRGSCTRLAPAWVTIWHAVCVRAPWPLSARPEFLFKLSVLLGRHSVTTLPEVRSAGPAKNTCSSDNCRRKSTNVGQLTTDLGLRFKFYFLPPNPDQADGLWKYVCERLVYADYACRKRHLPWNRPNALYRKLPTICKRIECNGKTIGRLWDSLKSSYCFRSIKYSVCRYGIQRFERQYFLKSSSYNFLTSSQ